MIQTKNCLYCGMPLNTGFMCTNPMCPSKQIQTYTYCSPPCEKLREIDVRLEQLEIFCFNKYLEDQPVPDMPKEKYTPTQKAARARIKEVLKEVEEQADDWNDAKPTPTDEDEHIKWATAKLERLVLRDEPAWTEKEIVEILRQLIKEVRS